MADIIEALHNLARQRGRGDASPLLALRTLPEREGARISHLPISQRLSQAWISLTGQPFRQHQALSLSALRRGDPFALIGGGPAARQTLHLLAFELLRGEAQSTVLLLAPDADAAELHLGELERLTAALGTPLRVAAAQGAGLRAAFGARMVVSSPSALHDRLLRHHDRAWQGFWTRLQLIIVADAHRYSGVAAGHLSALILRAQRLASGDPPPFLGVSMAESQGAGEVLSEVVGRSWRLIPVDDLPRPAVGMALWRSGGDRSREAVALALGLQRAGASAHIVCLPLEVAPLRALLGFDVVGVSVGVSPQIAQVQILTGAACGAAALHQAMDSDSRLSVLLLGDDPIERTIARLCARDPAHLPLIDDPPPAWVAAPANAYVVAQHLICAASELPITAAEVDAWQAGSIIARLESHQQLALLPEAGRAWQPLPGGGDPYEGFDMHAAGSAAPIIRDDQGKTLAALDPAAFDRWAFPGAALPPLRGGYRVVARDEGDLSLTIRAAGEGRRTFPLRRCTVRVRDCRERRELRGREVAWGRVVVDEEVYGYREVSPGGAPLDRALAPALTTSWSAPAVWVDLPMAVGATGQLIGWSMAAAIAVRTLLTLTDAVPAYDVEARRIYLVDAQPGGNGLAAWLYNHIEELLPLAYDIALDCRSDPLLEPLARADMDWLLGLLGGTIAPTPARQPVGQAAESGQPAVESREARPQQVVAPPVIPAPVRAPPRKAAPPAEPPRKAAPPAEPPRKAAPPPAPAPASGRGAASQSRRKKTADKASAHRESAPAPAAVPVLPPEPPPEPPPELPPEPLPPPEPDADPLPDAAAMVARLRRLRKQREQNAPPAPALRTLPRPEALAEPRFHAGDTVFCMPWGTGEVRSSKIAGDRELLVVYFADHGDLTIDTAVSAVRLIPEENPGQDDP